MAGYIGTKASVVSSGSERKKTYSITTTTTSLTGLAYTPGQVHVFHNGVRLVDNTDYTATNGTSITLTTAAQAGDEIVVLSSSSFQVSDTVSASNGGTFSGDVTFSGAFTSRGIDDNATSTAMTLNSSGVVTVGKTTTTSADDGVVLSPSIGSYFTRDADYAGLFNRRTSDGEIVQFRKDNTLVGTIGTINSTLVIGSGDTGLLFSDGDNVVIPRNSDTSARDAAIDLGDSGNRFKNLYLSGGVYLGGTGAANYLDDYETGTWTPTVGHGTATPYRPSYVKVGKLVTVWGQLNNFSDRSTVDNINIGGLPFTANPSYYQVAVGSAMWGFTNRPNTVMYITNSNTLVTYGSQSGGYSGILHSELNNSASEVYFTATYHAL